MTIRTILVDDEKLAIQGLQLRLQKFPDVEIIDTCNNGREAIRKIKTEKPDLVFLDIQMPGFDGFAIKVSPGFFDNPSLGLPSLNGLMLVLSARTCYPSGSW